MVVVIAASAILSAVICSLVYAKEEFCKEDGKSLLSEELGVEVDDLVDLVEGEFDEEEDGDGVEGELFFGGHARRQGWLGDELVLRDIMKGKCSACFFLRFFYPGGVVRDEAKNEKKQYPCGTEESGKDYDDDSSGVELVDRPDGWHPGVIRESFELIVKPGLGMNKQAQSEGCFAFGQSPLDAASLLLFQVRCNA
ncbi:hypothetical protein ARMGADRAFT_1040654 [Armillaria gallica]|uniref:Uncharacterized protein n=1 Tax=Armillaria gallica TaxID=47427 RepID=A0A2H3CWE1_ARMGA|nr:hypothetical protein ARMGADRAFT_1040654 [Armillaria gallica]